MDDVSLLARWRDGDQSSGRALFQRYFDPLFRFFATKCDEPDELIQATFMAVVRARDQFQGRSSFRTYLYQIARHELYRYLRTAQRTRDFDPDVSALQDFVTTPGARIARNQGHQQLLAALRSLPADQQTLLELHYWEGLDAAELAEVLEVSPGAIRTRLTRARAALRDRLLERAEAPAAALASIETMETWARGLAR